MATIADALNDVQKLQDAISNKINECRDLENSAFICDLMNFRHSLFLWFALACHTRRAERSPHSRSPPVCREILFILRTDRSLAGTYPVGQYFRDVRALEYL